MLVDQMVASSADLLAVRLAVQKAGLRVGPKVVLWVARKVFLWAGRKAVL